MKEYYNAKDIQTVIGCAQSKAYMIIRELQKKYQKKFPEAITIQGKIPIWYFNEVQGLRKKED